MSLYFSRVEATKFDHSATSTANNMPPRTSEWKHHPALRGRPQYRILFKHNVDSDGCTKRVASVFMSARRAAKAAIEADYESDFGDDGFVSGEGSVRLWIPSYTSTKSAICWLLLDNNISNRT